MSNTNEDTKLEEQQSPTGDSFPEGTYIIVSGLHSKAGKKLNGSHGMTLGKASFANGAWRCPVMIYALKTEQNVTLDELKVAIKKSIKVDNLEKNIDPKPVMILDAAHHEMKKASESADHKAAMFWARFHHYYYPEDAKYGCHYALMLIGLEDEDVVQNPEEARGIFERYFSKKSFKDLDTYMKCVFGCSMSATKTRDLEMGLEYASKLPMGVPRSDYYYFHALNAIVKMGTDILNDEPPFENAAISDIMVRAATELYKTFPTGTSMAMLGDAHCLDGNKLEAARCYRRSLSTGTLSGKDQSLVPRNLIVTQLQCPGMAFENKLVVWNNGQYLYAVDINDVKESAECAEGVRKSFKGEPYDFTGIDVDVYKLSVPEDADDSKFFPQSLLRKISV